MVFAVLVSSSCKKSAPAPIFNHSNDNFSKKNYAKYDNYKKGSSQTNVDRSRQEVEIGDGETLYSISRKYEVPLRDLIETNNLAAPYALKKGQVLAIPKPIYYRVQTGDTLYSISRKNNMDINEIIALNNMKEPYGVKVGSLIRIKKSAIKKDTPIETKMVDKSDVKVKEEAKDEKKDEKNDVKSEPLQIAKPTLKNDEKSGGFINNIFAKNNKFSWPISGAIISRFGPKKGGLYNDGINIKAKEGAPVQAAEDGVVAYVGNELKGYGNLVILKHSSGWITAYGHLSKTSVSRGAKVSKGQVIAKVGSTGNVDAPQLYFGLRKGREAVNPESYIKLKR